ncbi:GAD-like domain-containing protein [Pseudomonas sp. LB3P31]
MDEVFAEFSKTFGAPIDRREVPLSSIERYRGKVPNLLLQYWAEHGWCGYGEGIFWIVNPQEYEGVVASWLEGTEFEERDTCHLIARSAFGDLYLWGEKTGFSLKIDTCIARCVVEDYAITADDMDQELKNFLLSAEIEYNDFDDLFQPAKKKLGVLRHDEMYGFVPALMLGGLETLDHLEKLDAVVHLTILSQIAELQPYNFPDI